MQLEAKKPTGRTFAPLGLPGKQMVLVPTPGRYLVANPVGLKGLAKVIDMTKQFD